MCLVAVAGLMAIAFVAKALVSLVLLPIRVIGWLLFFPLLLLKGLFALISALIVVPLLIVAAVVTAIVFAIALVIPLFPLLAVAGLVWLIVKAGSRPAVLPSR